METKIADGNFNAVFSKAELENMALAMQNKLQANNHIIPIDLCLDIVSQQFGFTYQEVVDKFEDLEYQSKKYILKENWLKSFMDLQFPGWQTKKVIDPEEEYVTFVEYEIFGEKRGIHFDLHDVYRIIWKNLLEIMYLELSINPIEKIKFQNKYELAKYLLQNTSADTLIINNILHNIHKKMGNLPQSIRIQILDNIAYDYLPDLTDNKILYQNNI